MFSSLEKLEIKTTSLCCEENSPTFPRLCCSDLTLRDRGEGRETIPQSDRTGDYIPVGGEMLQESKEISHHHKHSPGPALHQLPDLHHELMLRLQL